MDWTTAYELARRAPRVELDGVRHVVVEGDVAVPETELRAWFLRRLRDAAAARGGFRLTGQMAGDGRLERWAPGTTLRWDLDDASFGDPVRAERARSAFRAAAAAWSEACVRLRFREVAAETPHFRVCYAAEAPRPGLLALAFFPWEFPGRRSIVLYPGFFASDPDAVALHELGHVCGFRHEHARPESGLLVDPDERAPLFPLSSYDAGSVMHYPTVDRNYFRPALSAADRAGAAAAYDATPAPEALMEPLPPTAPAATPTPATAATAAASVSGLPRLFELPPQRSTPGPRGAARPGSVGFGRAPLPFPVGIPRAGYALGAGKGSRFLTDFFVRAMLVEGSDGRVVALVVFDLHSGSRYLHEAVCHLTRKLPCALDNHELILAGTHTHLGPGYFYGCSLYDRLAAGNIAARFDEGLASLLATAAAQAVDQAWTRREAARVAVRQGQAWGLSWNRSLPAFHANASGWNPPGAPPLLSPTQRAVDPRVLTVAAYRADGSLLGHFSTFACHNTAMGLEAGQDAPTDFYDTDWAGRLAVDLERDLPADGAALVALSAAGDMSPMKPADLSDPHFPGQGLELVDRLVEGVGRAVRANLAAGPAPTAPELRVWYTDWVTRDGHTVGGDGGTRLAAPVLGAPTLGGAEDYRSSLWKCLRICHEGMKNDWFDPSDPQHPKAPAALVLLAKPFIQKAQSSPVHGVHVLHLNDHALVSFPGEPTVHAAAAMEAVLRAELEPNTTSVLGYANDYAGYVTTPAEYACQHYEGSSTLFGRNELAHFTATVRALLRTAAWQAPPRSLAPFDLAAAAVDDALEQAAYAGAESPTPSRVEAWWAFPPDAAPAAAEARVLDAQGRVHARGPTSRVDIGARVLFLAALKRPPGPLRLELDRPGAVAILLDGQEMKLEGADPFAVAAVATPPVSGGTDLDPDALLAGPVATPASGAAAARLGPTAAQMDAWRAQLAKDPARLGRSFAALADRQGRLTKAEAVAFATARMADLEALAQGPMAGAAWQPTPPPPDFDFPGYDPAAIPIDTAAYKFEPAADWANWVVHSGAAHLGHEAGTLQPLPMRRPQDFHSRFSHPLPDGATVALFADFGCGLPHALYLARQLVAERAQVAIHLGDVYYAGRPEEVEAYLHAPLAGMLDHTDLYLLAGNHDLYDRGRAFQAFVDRKRREHPATQRQEGEHFRLVGRHHQILGLDSQWWRPGRMSPGMLARLESWAREGREAGKMNILLSSDHPYDFGDPKPTKLWADVAPLASLVDLWFWGNTHHAALYDRDEHFPFVGSCIGWGGFPDARLDEKKAKKCAAKLVWAEYAWRYAPWPVREDRGNHGWCRMRLHEGGVHLDYVDWMGRLRARAEVDRTGVHGLEAFPITRP